LTNIGGIDEREFRKATRGVRESLKTEVKGKGRAIIDATAFKREMDAAFAVYFTTATPAVVEEQEQEMVTESDASIILAVPLQPEFGLALLRQHYDVNSPKNEGLIPTISGLISLVNASYNHRPARWRDLTDNLIRAGIDDDPNVHVRLHFVDEYEIEVQFVFKSPQWTVGMVKNAAGWDDGRQWYHIIDLSNDESPIPCAGSTCDLLSLNSPDLSSIGTYEEPFLSDEEHDFFAGVTSSSDEEHDAVAGSFQLSTLYYPNADSFFSDNDEERGTSSWESSSVGAPSSIYAESEVQDMEDASQIWASDDERVNYIRMVDDEQSRRGIF
jgi:hypothetical protein